MLRPDGRRKTKDEGRKTKAHMAMTHKERMLATLRGEPTDRMPWAPRLDLWYNAHSRAGTLPPEYRGADLADITDDLDMGFHAVVPHFKDLRAAEDDRDRALGIYNLWTMPYATVLEGVEVRTESRGDETIVEYRTPVGTLRTKVLYDERMRRAGISITHITEYAIKRPEDYEAVGYLFERARVVPNYEGYEAFADRVGDRGLAVGFISLAGSPMHLLQRELMPMELFFYELYDHPDELARCAAQIGAYFDRVFEVAVGCPAEVFLFGANYDARVTYPPFFEAHILPWLKRFADILHPEGKFLLTHTDEENTGLLDHYLASEIDIADSVCPVPMTKLSLRQVRDRFDGQITIMGGIPSVALLRNSMADAEFEAYLDRFFSELGAGDRLILGISDTTPPGAEFERIRKIEEYVRAFGGVGRRA